MYLHGEAQMFKKLEENNLYFYDTKYYIFEVGHDTRTNAEILLVWVTEWRVSQMLQGFTTMYLHH